MSDASVEPTRRILVADDDRDAVQILCDFLESRGWQSVAATEGQEALARFHDDGPFDLLLIDVMMPGIDGLELCRRVKASPQGQLTPVLMLSARSDTRSRIAGLYGGADDYLSKPVDLRELAARIEVLLRVRDRYVQLTQRKEQALDAALTDGLTGAVNRPYFLRRLSSEIGRCDRYSIPLSVVVLDVEGLPEPEEAADFDASLDDQSELVFAGPTFKLVQATSEAVASAIRSHDLLARLHRGRFAVMMPHTSRTTIASAVARIQQAVAGVPLDPDKDDGPPAGLSLRVGTSELQPRMDAVTLLARAEPR